MEKPRGDSKEHGELKVKRITEYFSSFYKLNQWFVTPESQSKQNFSYEDEVPVHTENKMRCIVNRSSSGLRLRKEKKTYYLVHESKYSICKPKLMIKRKSPLKRDIYRALNFEGGLTSYKFELCFNKKKSLNATPETPNLKITEQSDQPLPIIIKPLLFTDTVSQSNPNLKSGDNRNKPLLFENPVSHAHCIGTIMDGSSCDEPRNSECKHQQPMLNRRWDGVGLSYLERIDIEENPSTMASCKMIVNRLHISTTKTYPVVVSHFDCDEHLKLKELKAPSKVTIASSLHSLSILSLGDHHIRLMNTSSETPGESRNTERGTLGNSTSSELNEKASNSISKNLKKGYITDVPSSDMSFAIRNRVTGIEIARGGLSQGNELQEQSNLLSMGVFEYAKRKIVGKGTPCCPPCCPPYVTKLNAKPMLEKDKKGNEKNINNKKLIKDELQEEERQKKRSRLSKYLVSKKAEIKRKRGSCIECIQKKREERQARLEDSDSDQSDIDQTDDDTDNESARGVEVPKRQRNPYEKAPVLEPEPKEYKKVSKMPKRNRTDDKESKRKVIKTKDPFYTHDSEQETLGKDRKELNNLEKKKPKDKKQIQDLCCPPQYDGLVRGPCPKAIKKKYDQETQKKFGIRRAGNINSVLYGLS